MKRIAFITLVVLLSPWLALAQSTQPAITLTTDVEEGKKMLSAQVALNGKPLANVNLQYFVQRTFGILPIGQDTTLDDGTSAVAFPSDLPGAVDGKLHFIVRIKSPAQYASSSISSAFAADVPPVPAVDPFPRALWAPHAPLLLMLSIFAILAAVWLSYVFVVMRILAIRRGGQK
jgi:hypothetical protein